ncbi:putative peptidylprolyl isomerase CWC27 [Sugiyamaella lignohabitans]|uniref:Putative peptidylprolyl isomerase CWC27 n=1 Tax=Sugiyamaella lignohabitans TaxID=796027 RepID=A0A167DZ98_9ASCO|nr:putative peptidylprolyl isomerase CWC27 [Sugiyamaella lignohabitans]ANB13468.1 putative peptidylprolyl isomerase CWC27 [Sugiyamaella lignohabitans]
MEPATTARVILHTTKGPIEIELWAKETPLTSRNFIQLCLNGYYDNCTFHRVVKDFIVQSGDPSGTGFGGQSIYDGGMFNDEFNSRLRFNKRGIVASANTGQKNSNGSQFIITLVQAPELNNKNTIFGRIGGETFYNVLQIAEGAVDDEKPLYPVVIERTEVVIPYFTDLQAKAMGVVNKSSHDPSNKPVPKKKKPKVRISYGSEEDTDDTETGSVKIRPAHELLKDRKLKKAPSHHTSELQVDSVLLQTPSQKEEQSSISNSKEHTSLSANSNKRPQPPVQTDTKSKKQKPETKEEREKVTLEMLKKFQSKVSRSPSTLVASTAAQLTSNGGLTALENTWNSDDDLPSDYEDEIDDSAGLWDHKFETVG